MTEKRYTKQIDSVADTIIDIQKDGKDFAWFLLDDYTNDEVDKVIGELNHLHEENTELRQDNDIKFWKLQCIQSSNNNQIMLFELSRAIQQGYEVSDKFKQYLDEIKEHDKEIREKHKRLFE